MVYSDFDSVLRDVGEFGPYQVYNLVLIGLSGTPAGAHSLANVFLAGTPDHWCASASSNASTPAPRDVSDDVCHVTSQRGNETVEEKCTAWEYDDSVFGSTIVTEVSGSCNALPSRRVLTDSTRTNTPSRPSMFAYYFSCSGVH